MYISIPFQSILPLNNKPKKSNQPISRPNNLTFQNLPPTHSVPHKKNFPQKNLYHPSSPLPYALTLLFSSCSIKEKGHITFWGDWNVVFIDMKMRKRVRRKKRGGRGRGGFSRDGKLCMGQCECGAEGKRREEKKGRKKSLVPTPASSIIIEEQIRLTPDQETYKSKYKYNAT